jgi:hypothetical protein
MKLALLLIFLFPLISFAQVDQELIPEFNVSSGKLSVVVPKVLEELELTYIVGSLNTPRRKYIEQHTFINTSIQEILDYLYEDTKYRLEFDEEEQTIHFIERKYNDYITVTGRVQSSNSGGGIVDVHVSSVDGAYKTITDPNGFYSLRVPKNLDSLNLCFSHIQFINAKGWVVIANALRKEKIIYNKSLRLEVIEIPGVNVSDKVPESAILPFFSNNSIDGVFFSESLNPERFLFLSGADQFFRMEGGISFKGAPSSMNLFLLDGIPLSEPFKLKGLIPIAEDDVTKGLKIYEGVSPARYPGSSMVVDILSEDGNITKEKGLVKLTDQYGSFTLTGPIENNSSSYFFNFRSSYGLNRLSNGFKLPSFLNNPFYQPTEFAEFTGKLSAQINTYNIFSFSTFYGSETILDYLDPLHRVEGFNLSGIKAKEVNVVAKWNNRSITNANLNFSTAYKHYNKTIGLEEDISPFKKYEPKGQQDELNLNGIIEVGLRNNLSLVAGLNNDLIFYSYSDDKVYSLFRDSVNYDYTSLFKRLHGKVINRFAGFTELNKSFDKISFSLGLRMTKISNLKFSNSLEPRLIFKYKPNLDQSNVFEVNYGRNLISEYSLYSNDRESYMEYSFMVNALSDGENQFRPFISNEINVNYKVLIKEKLFMEIGHFMKNSKGLIVDAQPAHDSLLLKVLPSYTMLGISFKGALQLNENWYLSSMISYKDFVNYDDSLAAVRFKYKYGLLLRKYFNNNISAEFHYLNYKEGFTGTSKGRVSNFDFRLNWSLSSSFKLGVSYEYFIHNLDLLNQTSGNLNLSAVLEF